MSNRGKPITILVLSIVVIALFTGIVSAATYNLTGRVTDQSGNPLEGTVIEVLDPGTSTVVTSTTTDASGNYSVSVEEGIYDLRVIAPTTSDFGEALLENQEINDDATLDFILVHAGSVTLSGRILDGEGIGIADQYVNLHSTEGQSIEVKTDGNGDYSFSVAPGDYRMDLGGSAALTSAAPDYYNLHHDYEEPLSLSEDTVLDITLPVKKVTIHVQDSSGGSVADVGFTANNSGNFGYIINEKQWGGSSQYYDQYSYRTDANGDIILWLFPTTSGNNYTISAYPPEGTPFPFLHIQDISVLSDMTENIFLQFVHAPPETVALLSPQSDQQGRYPDPVTVTLSATATDGFAIETTYYSIDGSDKVFYTAPFEVSGDGLHTIKYWSVDNFGVYETPKTLIFNIKLANLPPTIESIKAPAGPININEQPVSMAVTFSDPDTLDTHNVRWDWGDGSHNTTASATSPATKEHIYTETGTYTVEVTVTDKEGDSASATHEYIVVYDPKGGFVTGGGWIVSPAGAYITEPELTGKANFGFVSKYKKGADTPIGNTEFQFKAGDLNFHSNSYDWLVVAGAKAMFKGIGTINGDGNYGFMLSAIDAAKTPSTDTDLFRIKIWDKDNGDAVVYDNQIGVEKDADPTTEIGGGNIIVHKSK